jgi:hypothetical protein
LSLCPVKPHEPSTAETEAPAKRAKRGYAEKLPKLNHKASLRLLEPGDASMLDHFGLWLADPADSPGWDSDPLGWGRVELDADKLRHGIGEEGLQNLIDRGWVSHSRVYGGGESRDSYGISLSAKMARYAAQIGLEEVEKGLLALAMRVQEVVEGTAEHHLSPGYIEPGSLRADPTFNAAWQRYFDAWAHGWPMVIAPALHGLGSQPAEPAAPPRPSPPPAPVRPPLRLPSTGWEVNQRRLRRPRGGVNLAQQKGRRSAGPGLT